MLSLMRTTSFITMLKRCIISLSSKAGILKMTIVSLFSGPMMTTFVGAKRKLCAREKLKKRRNIVIDPPMNILTMMKTVKFQKMRWYRTKKESTFLSKRVPQAVLSPSVQSALPYLHWPYSEELTLNSKID